MAHDIFISYSRTDEQFALRLVRDLRDRDFGTWLDQLDIPPGVNWDDEIEKAIDRATTVIVIVSEVSTKSENVKNEISAALERGKLVVPVGLDAEPAPFRISRLQREDFSGDYAAALDKLAHRLSGGGTTATLDALTPVPSEPGRERPAQDTSERFARSHPDSLLPASTAPQSSSQKAARPPWLWAAAGAALAAAAMTTLAARMPDDADREPTQAATVDEGTADKVETTPAPDTPASGNEGNLSTNGRPDTADHGPDATGTKTTETGVTSDPTALGVRADGVRLCPELDYKGECKTLAEGDIDFPVRSFERQTCACVRLCPAQRKYCKVFNRGKRDLYTSWQWKANPDKRVATAECLRECPTSG